MTTIQTNLVRKKLRVSGVVQGVGFRPFVWKRATKLGLTGWVINDSSGVTMEIQGSPSQIDAFLESFESSAPPLALIDSVAITDIGIDRADAAEFSILHSKLTADKSTPISPDISICDECLRELNDPTDRRFRYPFINCTHCGPRFTIVQDIPYDRPSTTMSRFPMCPACRREYESPADRRFHAQPNACPDCGPAIWFVSEPSTKRHFASTKSPECAGGTEHAIEQFQTAILSGKIVAVKGIGGFHLACDATNASAIEKLRQRKGRSDKPLAIMVRDVQQATRFARVSAQERKLLESKQRPIVLLERKTLQATDETAPHDLVAPGNRFVGVMLPYSPLHYLLLGEKPLVLTSANVSDEPIVRTNQEAWKRLRQLADSFLLHDRDIEVVCDDSVVRCVGDSLVPIRRSRGYAPMPVRLAETGRNVLAVGGELKSTFCASRGDDAFMSQHIGDMGNLETLNALTRSVDHFMRIFRITPEVIVGDLHPGYLSTQWAGKFAESRGLTFLQVQHHHAHVASLLAEHQFPADRSIIGCCFDGTGFGPDETIWGGEFLIANGLQFSRFAHLENILMPGGDACIGKPYRTALAHLHAVGIEWDDRIPSVQRVPSVQRGPGVQRVPSVQQATQASRRSPATSLSGARPINDERTILIRQLERRINCVATSSMGRLFDAVASLIGIRHEVNFEAQAAMELEALAAGSIDLDEDDSYSFSLLLSEPSPVIITLRRVLSDICEDHGAGVSRSRISARFHRAVATMVRRVCERARSQTGLEIVGLTGGVFQNVLLLRLTVAQLEESGFEVLTHHIVPANDAGIALGQAFVGCSRTVNKNG